MLMTDRLAPSRTRDRPTCISQNGVIACCAQSSASTSASPNARDSIPATASMAAVEDASATFWAAWDSMAATTASV